MHTPRPSPRVGTLVAVLFVQVATSACGADRLPGPDPTWLELELGDPIPGLTEEELASFERGRALFTRVFRPEEGLGPIFAASACDACHTDPVPGGVASDRSMYVVRTSRWSEEGCDLLLDQGGDFVRERATPALQAAGIHGDRAPEEGTHSTRYSMRPLYGLGLVEAIPDATILALAELEDRMGNGIAGRAPLDADGRVARFARKGLASSLSELVEASVRLDLGLTTPDHPNELGPNRGPLPPGIDPVPNPELTREELEDWTAFVRFLAPPAPRVPTDPEQRRVVEDGRDQFLSVGCGMCHLPALSTGPNENPALAHQPVHLYSDLLLHDMGDELEGTCGPTAGPTEIRTEMLWGLQYRDQFMHDGRARTVREAIDLHGGTAAESRERFRKLSPMEQHALLRFLDTL